MKDRPEIFTSLSTLPKDIFDFNNEDKFRKNNRKALKRRIFSRWQTLFAVACVMIIFFIAVAAPLLAPVVSNEGAPWYKIVCERNHCIPEPPSITSPLGAVKEFDVYYTLIWGMRQALIFGLLTTSITALIGTVLGLSSAYYGGWLSGVIMRICDAFMAFPIVAGVALFAQASVLLTATLPRINSNIFASAKEALNFFQALIIKADPIFIALILFSWMGYTRIIHSQVLQIKKRSMSTLLMRAAPAIIALSLSTFCQIQLLHL